MPLPRSLLRLLTPGALTALFAAGALAQPQTPPVDVAHPLVERIIDYDVFTGRFEAADRVEIRARVSGYLDTVGFEDGDLVEEGELLFVIDQRPFEVAIARARAGLEAAKAASSLARIEFDRAAQLAERNVGTVQEVDRTRAGLAEAAAQVGVAEAELANADLDLGFTEIRAPFAGRMSATEVDPGNLITGGAGGATLLGTLVRIDPIYFAFTASEADYLRYARLVESGARPSPRKDAFPVAVKLMDEEGFVHGGRLNFVDNELDPNSGTIEGRAVIDNPELYLVPGLFGRIRVPASVEYDAVLLPDVAILSDQARKIVMTVDAEGTVTPRPVQPGDLHRGLRVISEGLGPDDLVVVNGVQRARPGAKVMPEMVEISFPDEAAGTVANAGDGDAADTAQPAAQSADQPVDEPAAEPGSAAAAEPAEQPD